MSAAATLRLFLSASVPLPSRNPVYFDTADVIAIRDAVRALTMVVVEEQAQLVFGGHPAITPMIRLQIAQTGTPVGDRIMMFQSRYFERTFPQDNAAFERVKLVDAVPNDQKASLLRMREAMLAGHFIAGFFIGGMEGVEDEYGMFLNLHPGIPTFPIASTGAAAAKLFDADPDLKREHPELREEISYLTLMRDLFDRAQVSMKSSGHNTYKARGVTTHGVRQVAAFRGTKGLQTVANDFLINELKGIHSAERQLSRALPRMARNACSERLREMLERRREQSSHLIETIDEALEEIGTSRARKKNVAIEGLIEDVSQHADEIQDERILQAAVLASVQKIEHYCIAAWGTAKSLGKLLGQQKVVEVMERALEEGKQFDQEMTQLAEGEVNVAMLAEEETGEEEGEEETEEDEEGGEEEGPGGAKTSSRKKQSRGGRRKSAA